MIKWRVRNSKGDIIAEYESQHGRLMKGRDVIRLYNSDDNNVKNSRTVAYISLNKYIVERVDQQT